MYAQINCLNGIPKQEFHASRAHPVDERQGLTMHTDLTSSAELFEICLIMTAKRTGSRSVLTLNNKAAGKADPARRHGF